MVKSIENMFMQKDNGMKVSDPQNESPAVMEAHEEDAMKKMQFELRLLWEFRKVFTDCLMISFSTFLFGFDTGLIGGIINMKSFISKLGYQQQDGTYKIDSHIVGLIVSTYHIGCIIGGFTIGRLADYMGRKPLIFIAMITYMIGITIQMTTTISGKWFQYVIGRFISGLCIGSIAVLSPMLLSESAPTSIRGTCTSLFQLNVCFAALVGSIVVFTCKEMYEGNASWIVPLGIGIPMALCVCIGITLTPESARYLVSVGKYEEARKSLHFVKESNVEVALLKLQESIDIGKRVHRGWLFMFQKQYLKRVILGISLMAFQQSSGIDYFFYYGTSLFKYAGLNDSYVTAIIFAVVNFFVTLPSVYTVDKFGRKKSLMYGSAGGFVSLLGYSLVGTLKINRDIPVDGDSSENKVPGIVMIMFTCLFIISNGPTWGACTTVLVSELFPLNVRAHGIALSTAFNWGTNFAISFCSPIITDRIGYSLRFVFCGCMFVAGWFIWLMVPETQGVSLEEVETLFEKV